MAENESPEEGQAEDGPVDERTADELSADELREKLRKAELEEGRMPFFEHLRELRTRLRNSVIALVVGFVVAYIFRNEIFAFLTRPLTRVWAKLHAANPESIPDTPALVFTGLIEPFWVDFSLAFWAGIFVASPFIFYQFWKFIAPGLYKNERNLGVTFAVTSALLFIAGASFCYVFVLEAIYDFLLGYASQDISRFNSILGGGSEVSVGELISLQPMLKINEYLAFVKKILIGFGLAFELPLLIFFLSLIGVVTHRGLWRFNRWAAILAFVGAAALTPPDIVSQTFLAGPLLILYNLSIIVAWVVTRRRERRQAALAAEYGDADDDDDDDDDEEEDE